MANISLSTIRARIDECNEVYEHRNFILTHNALDSRRCYMVDLCDRAAVNLLGRVVVGFLTKGLPEWDFELYFVNEVAADEYLVNPGYYLAISFYL